MIRMKIKLLISLGLISCASTVQALDLFEAYSRAKSTDPAWQANVLQYEADQLNLGIAKSMALPRVTVSGSVARNNQDIDIRIVPLRAKLKDTSTPTQIGIGARQPIFRMDIWENIQQAKTSNNLSEINLKLQQQNHILNVAESYFNVLRQQSLTAAYLQEEQALSEQLRMMNAKLNEGLVAQSDVSEANAQYQNARANRMSTHVQLVLAQEQLQQLIGPYRDNLAVLRDDFQFQTPVPNDLNSWVTMAQSKNLNILQARLQTQLADDQRRVEKADLYPKVDLVASYGTSEQKPYNLFEVEGESTQVGVEMSWDVFNGGRTQKSIKQAGLNVQKSEAQLESAIRRSNTDVKKSFMQVETDQSKLQARQAAMQSSEMVSNASKAQYNEGLRSMVDVLLAQRNAFSAKTDYLNAKYDYLIHVLQLKATVGQLDENALKEMNAWLVEK